ncbi:MAG: hypothetical protein AWM53_01998 [Candidatus Dichloromethanomonas elyunquensis]|nr:MAG: hypothetical protein AWM53_01998 [Candidatus Dichloromethanomonas elyunquensis]
MGLLNYTTKIDVHTTLGEIQKILVEHGARKIMQDFDEKGKIASLNFSMMTTQGEAGFRLPANVPQAFEVLKQQKRKKYSYHTCWTGTEEHSSRPTSKGN